MGLNALAAAIMTSLILIRLVRRKIKVQLRREINKLSLQAGYTPLIGKDCIRKCIDEHNEER